MLLVPLPRLAGKAMTLQGVLSDHLGVDKQTLEDVLTMPNVKVLLLLDALDEVPAEGEARDCSRVLLGDTRHPNVSMVVSTRPKDDVLFREENWQDCECVSVKGFGEKQMNGFVQRAGKILQ